jgi:hypothetical protein
MFGTVSAVSSFAEEGSNDRDVMYSESSDDDDNHTGRVKEPRNATVLFLLRNHKNLAEPRSSRASFGPNGMCKTCGIFLC